MTELELGAKAVVTIIVCICTKYFTPLGGHSQKERRKSSFFHTDDVQSFSRSSVAGIWRIIIFNVFVILSHNMHVSITRTRTRTKTKLKIMTNNTKMPNKNQWDEFTPPLVVDHSNIPKEGGATMMMMRMITTPTIFNLIRRSLTAVMLVGLTVTNYCSSIEDKYRYWHQHHPLCILKNRNFLFSLLYILVVYTVLLLFSYS